MRVLTRALAPEQSQRYQTAKQFESALREAMSKKPGLLERLFSK